MPTRKKTNLSKISADARAHRNQRNIETYDNNLLRLQEQVQRQHNLRLHETPQQTQVNN